MSQSATELLRWLGVAALLGMVLTAVAVQMRERFDASRSASQAWSRSRRSYLLTGVSMTLCGAVLCLSMMAWLIPHYGLSALMYPLVGLAYVALLAVAWVPIAEKPGEHQLSHPHFIGGAVVATGAVVGFLCILSAEPAVPVVSFWLSVVALAYTVLWPVFFVARLRRYFLLLEIGIVMWFVSVITALTIGV